MISIIIPVYNGANFLAQAINSALEQTYRNIEILVINDGSNDAGATERIALSYGDRVRYFKKSNGGVATALNFGIDKMLGEYFSWLSHDDLYVKEKIEQQVKFISSLSSEDRDRVIAYSDFYVFTTDSEITMPILMRGVIPDNFRYWLTMESAIHGCTLLIPKRAFNEMGKFSEQLRTTQDYDLWFRMAKNYSFVYLPGCLVKSRSHPEQGSIKMSEIAKSECNALLSGFIVELTHDELLFSSGKLLSVAYATIAGSMWRRGFFKPGWLAIRLSFKNLQGASSFYASILTVGLVLKGIAMHYFVKLIYKITLPSLRKQVKKWLRSQRTNESVHPNSELKDRFTEVHEKNMLNGSVSRSLEGLNLEQIDVIHRETPTILQTQRAPEHAPPNSLHSSELKDKFVEVYEKNLFEGSLSRSGEGSNLLQTDIIRREIPIMLQNLGIKVFIDAPCGDWYWMKTVDLPVEQYIGVDIVDALIEKNQNQFGDSKTAFRCVNLAEDELPKADLIFSRDCLVHLSFQDALKIIANFKRSGAKYLLATTFINREKNEDLGDGFWRPLNKQVAPFNFPEPIQLINEGCTEGNNLFTDKCLGLWLLDDIRIDELVSN